MDDTGKTPIFCEFLSDEPDMTDIVAGFVDGLPERLTAMRRALDEGELDRLATLAHQLKGAGGGFGYRMLTETAADLETTARSGVRQELDRGMAALADLVERIAAGLPHR